MTVKILKSQVAIFGGQFEVLVAQHAKDMADWRAHMLLVTNDAAARIPAERAHAPYPPPVAAPLVDQCVNEESVADYEVVNDDPTADEQLADKKSALLTELTRRTAEEFAKISSPARTKLYSIRAQEILVLDEARRQSIREEIAKDTESLGVIRQQITNALADPALSSPDDATRNAALAVVSGLQEQYMTLFGVVQHLESTIPATVRSPSDEQFMQEQAARDAAGLRVEKWNAQMHAEIEDLTADTIGTWNITEIN